MSEAPRSSTALLMEQYFDRLWPIMRSITGEGVRQTHDILAELLPLERTEVPSGTSVYDWTVPEEWEVREAWLLAPDGRRIADIRDNTLHLVNYSCGFQGTLSLEALQPHLHSIPERPHAIPYVTSYYARDWGFCIPHAVRMALQPGQYTVHIDARHFAGSMTMSQAVLPGQTDREVLFSTYTCHPSMANNELSGPLVAAFLYRELAAMPCRRYTYRFHFGPETIGAIAYLSRLGTHFRDKLDAGLVLTCIGGDVPFTCKRSRQSNALVDRILACLLRERGAEHVMRDFWPGGSDERQYCSPGFDLPVGVLCRAVFGEYPEYHTSDDDKSAVSFTAMAEAVELCRDVVQALEANRVYVRTNPHCEPFLSRYDLHDTIGAQRSKDVAKKTLQWLLNLADGGHDLVSMAERSGLPLAEFRIQAQRAEQAGLIKLAEVQ